MNELNDAYALNARMGKSTIDFRAMNLAKYADGWGRELLFSEKKQVRNKHRLTHSSRGKAEERDACEEGNK